MARKGGSYHESKGIMNLRNEGKGTADTQPRSVRAAVLEKPGQLNLVSIEQPKLPFGSVMLEIEACGICGTDRHLYKGEKPLGKPVILGHEIVGRIVSVDPEAKREIRMIGGPLDVGTRVAVVPGFQSCGECFACQHLPARSYLCGRRPVYGYGNFNELPHLLGGFAERMIILPGSWLYALPEEMPLRRAVLIEPVSVAMRAVERALAPGFPGVREGVGLGQSAVVLGVGALGLSTIGVLKSMGIMPIIAVDENPYRLNVATKLGADVVVDIRKTTLEERIREVRKLTEGAGSDLVVECAGVPAAFSEALALVRRGGTLVEVGHAVDVGSVQLHPYDICYGDFTIVGSYVFPPTQFGPTIKLLKHSPLPFEEIVTGELSLEQTEVSLQSIPGKESIKEIVIPSGIS